MSDRRNIAVALATIAALAAGCARAVAPRTRALPAPPANIACSVRGRLCGSFPECFRVLRDQCRASSSCQARIAKLARRRGTSSVPGLLPWLASRDVEVRSVAGHELQQLGARGVAYLRDSRDARAWRGLIEFVDWGPDSGEAARALQMRALDDVPGVLEALRLPYGSSVTNPALTVARVTGDTEPTWVPVFEHALARGRASDWTLARNAATALGLLGRREALPPLLASLESPDWRLVLASLEAVVRIGDLPPGELAHIESLARSHWSLQVRTEARDAIAVLERHPAHVANGQLLEALEHDSLFEVLAHRGGEPWPLPPLHPPDFRTWGPFHFPSRGHFVVFPTWHGPLRCRSRRAPDLPYVTVTYQGRIHRLRALEGRRTRAAGIRAVPDCGGLVQGTAVVARGCFAAVLRLGSRVVALQGPGWEDERFGRVDAIERRNGGPALVPLVELPDEASWVETAHDGTLLIGTASGDVALDASAQVEALGCP